MKKAIFLDRDGVINEVCYHDEKGIYSARSLDEFKLLPGVKDSIARLNNSGFLTIIISNQPGVAFGYIKKEDVEKINESMKKELGISQVYNCFHHPEFTGDCNCRKPKDGMILSAIADHNIDLSESFLIGDNLTDIKAGEKCKQTFLVAKKTTADLLNLIETKNIRPTHIVSSLKEATDKILN